MLNPKPSGESGADGQVHGVAAPHAHPQGAILMWRPQNVLIFRPPPLLSAFGSLHFCILDIMVNYIIHTTSIASSSSWVSLPPSQCRRHISISPKLEATCGRYLDSQRPLLSPSDYARTEETVKEFQNGLGRELDTRDSVQTWVSHNYFIFCNITIGEVYTK